MAMHDAGGIILHLADADEALAHSPLAGIGHLEFLEVGVEAGRGVLRQNAVANPIVQMLGRAGVDVVGVVVGREALAQDHAHQIVGAGREILGLHLGTDLVVGLREQLRRIASLRGVAVRSEGFYSGQ